MLLRALTIASLSFLAGVALRSSLPITPIEASSFIVVGVLCVGVAVWSRSEIAAGLALVCAFALIGVIHTDASLVSTDARLVARTGERVVITGSVIAEPDVRERNTRLVVSLASLHNEWIEGVRLLVIAPAFARVEYGDRIEAEGLLRIPEAFETGEGRLFNYPMFLRVRGISHEVAFANVRVIDGGGNPFVENVLRIKHAYMRALQQVLPEPYAGLAAGITAGDKRSVGSELSGVFQDVSLVHILVLSGYNITLVLGLLAIPFSRLSRAWRIVAVLLVALFFIVISGWAASAVRASGMSIAAVYAQLYGRRFVALRILTAIVVLMVVWNPLLLLFDPGFQLSVLATLGLILLSVHVARVVAWVPERAGVREIVSATIATQIAVLPLLLFQGGVLSLVALPANICALIAVPFAMIASFCAALFGALFGSAAVVVAFPAYVLLWYIVAIAEFFASLPLSTVAVPAFSPVVLLLTYIAITVVYVFLERRTRS